MRCELEWRGSLEEPGDGEIGVALRLDRLSVMFLASSPSVNVGAIVATSSSLKLEPIHRIQ